MKKKTLEYFVAACFAWVDEPRFESILSVDAWLWRTQHKPLDAAPYLIERPNESTIKQIYCAALLRGLIKPTLKPPRPAELTRKGRKLYRKLFDKQFAVFEKRLENERQKTKGFE